MAATAMAILRGAESGVEIDFELLEFLRDGCYLSIEIVFERRWRCRRTA
jgi:hypothetical protein